jgi:hypothetical protein
LARPAAGQPLLTRPNQSFGASPILPRAQPVARPNLSFPINRGLQGVQPIIAKPANTQQKFTPIQQARALTQLAPAREVIPVIPAAMARPLLPQARMIPQALPLFRQARRF